MNTFEILIFENGVFNPTGIYLNANKQEQIEEEFIKILKVLKKPGILIVHPKLIIKENEKINPIDGSNFVAYHPV